MSRILTLFNTAQRAEFLRNNIGGNLSVSLQLEALVNTVFRIIGLPRVQLVQEPVAVEVSFV